MRISATPKISIIVPTLARGAQAGHFPRLKNLLSTFLPDQTYKHYEVAVWCDGPNDKVDAMVGSLKDHRIKVFRTDRTLAHWGHPQTRLGVAEATGDYFVRMNDDNRPYRRYLESLVSAFDGDTGMVYGRVVFRDDARRDHGQALHHSFVIPQDKRGVLRDTNIDCMCYMVRMDLAKKYINFWNDEFGADWFFIEALVKHGVKCKFIDLVIGEKF